MTEAQALMLAHALAEAFLFAFVAPLGLAVLVAVAIGMYFDLRRRDR